MAIKNEFLVEKRNILNELRPLNMTLQEMRFFCIYLARINARNPGTRVVRFTLENFRNIMELKQLNIPQLKNTANGLLTKIVNIPNEDGGFSAFQLFKECTVFRDSTGKWYIEIDAHDKALPLMFNFKNQYFTYKLWNALHLRSRNQLRMYEILKQYEKLGERILSISNLRDLLGIEKTEYVRFKDFRSRILDACQEALSTYSDISYTYEPYGKRGPGGKILHLKFTIFRNEDYVDRIGLEKWISEDEMAQLTAPVEPIVTVPPAYQPQAAEPRYSPEPAHQPQAAEPRYSPEPAHQPQAAEPRYSPEPAHQPQAAEPRYSPEPAYQPQAAEPRYSPEPAYQPQAAEPRYSPEPAHQPQTAEPRYSPEPAHQPQAAEPRYSTEPVTYIDEDEDELQSRYDNDSVAFLAEACKHEFNNNEMLLLLAVMGAHTFPHQYGETMGRFHYLLEKYRELCYRASTAPISNRFAYMRKMIQNDLRNQD